MIIKNIIQKYNNIFEMIDYEKKIKAFEPIYIKYIIEKNKVIYNSVTVLDIYNIYELIRERKKIIIDDILKKYLEDIDDYYVENNIIIEYDKGWANTDINEIINENNSIVNISDEMFNNISNIYNLNIIILSIEDGKLIIKKITVPGINIIDTKTILKSIEYFLKYPTIILLNENENEYSTLYNKNDIITYDTIINIIKSINKIE